MSTSPVGAATGAPTGGPPAAPAGGPAHRAPEPPDPAELVRDAVLGVPGVAAMHPGPSGTLATYLPGRRVAGVALRGDGSAEVAVTATAVRGLRTDLQALGTRVRAAVSPLVPGPVRVVVADLRLPDAP